MTGATGYIGGRLLARLEGDRRHGVRCLTRRPEALAGRTADDTEIFAGGVLVPDSLTRPMAGVDSAYYLVHSMVGQGDFSQLDRAGARNFAAAARTPGVKRIVYLGGLGAEAACRPTWPVARRWAASCTRPALPPSSSARPS